MAFFCSPNVWGPNCYVERARDMEKEKNSSNPWHKGGCVVCVLQVGGWWDWKQKTGTKSCNFSLRKVRQSPRLPRIFCSVRENSVTFDRLSQLDFKEHTVFPSPSRARNKANRWSKKSSGTNWRVIIQIKKKSTKLQRPTCRPSLCEMRAYLVWFTHTQTHSHMHTHSWERKIK